MFHTGDTCAKTGETILQVIRLKHPEARPATAVILDSYVGAPPALVPVDVKAETVAKVGRRISSGT